MVFATRRFSNMGKTLLIFLLISYKLSFCSAASGDGVLRHDHQNDELLISEVLFNPKSGGTDFVEIYNPGSQAISLTGLYVGNLDSAGQVANLRSLGNENLGSGNYLVISKSDALIKAHYYCPAGSQFINLSSMPAYNNGSGHVILCRNGIVTDHLDYTEKMHHPLLNIVDGVSLERISFIVPANAKGNFISAASTVGFATPGYANSSQENPALPQSTLSCSGKSFSPDGDGIDDEFYISWQFIHSGNMATAEIYSDKGVFIKKLLKNESLGTQGRVSWDGRDEKGRQAPYGLYIIVFHSFDTKGNTFRQRKVCALVGRI